jgi:hypothetical protein
MLEYRYARRPRARTSRYGHRRSSTPMHSHESWSQCSRSSVLPALRTSGSSRPRSRSSSGASVSGPVASRRYRNETRPARRPLTLISRATVLEIGARRGSAEATPAPSPDDGSLQCSSESFCHLYRRSGRGGSRTKTSSVTCGMRRVLVRNAVTRRPVARSTAALKTASSV